MFDSLKYSDETDRSLGIAGMAIALLACDGEQFIAEVSVEDGEDSLNFSPEAFFTGNPRFSAKIAWMQNMREYHIYSGLVLGNILCRRVVSSNYFDDVLLGEIHDLIAEHGLKCSLEQDEIDELFEKDLHYFRRLFSHPAVADVARDFAATLRFQRRMTAGEVFENLKRLSSI